MYYDKQKSVKKTFNWKDALPWEVEEMNMSSE